MVGFKLDKKLKRVTLTKMRTINVCRLLLSVALIQLFLNLNATAYSLPLEEGSSCDLKLDEGSGTCVLVTNCPPALESIKARSSHDFNRCGFHPYRRSGSVRDIEVVCCPNTSISGKEDDNNDDDNITTTTTPSTTSTNSTTTSQAEVRGPVIRKSVQVCEDLAERIGPKLSFQILGGVDAQLGEFPHMAALGYQVEGKIQWQCGGSLISDRYVLTAAHCIVKPGNNPPTRIRLGKIDISGDTDNDHAEDVAIANITIHPKYNRTSRQNDIALIKLDGVVKNSENVNPACLYTKDDDPPLGLVITGWGVVSVGGDPHHILQKGYLVPVPLTKCNSKYQDTPLNKFAILRNQFCAISSDGKTDACQGDSGGPLQIQSIHASSVYSIVGVTSFGRGCGGSYPGVYSRVYSYLDWIEEIVWPK